MGRNVMLSCNCGCGVKEERESGQAGWLELRQIKKVGEKLPDNAPKLDGCLCFSSFECLHRWSEKSLVEIQELQKATYGLHPRGRFSSKEADGLYV